MEGLWAVNRDYENTNTLPSQQPRSSRAQREGSSFDAEEMTVPGLAVVSHREKFELGLF